jgi:hypothetical protein
MNEKFTFIYLISLFLLGGLLVHANSNYENKEEEKISLYESSYTSISQKDCRTLESDNLGSIQECESFAGMKVTVIEGDIRQSITLARDDKKYELSFWNTISYGFSSLGLELEWRYLHNQFYNPVGVIVRLDVNEDEENTEKVTSYLVVSKITEKEICVVGKIIPQKSQKEVARRMVESSHEMKCIGSLKLKAD